MTEMFGEAWSPMSVPDLAPDDDDDHSRVETFYHWLILVVIKYRCLMRDQRDDYECSRPINLERVSVLVSSWKA